MNRYAIIFGIDVSKDTLDIYAIDPQKNYYIQVNNKATDILHWIKSFDAASALCIFEHTGCYGSRLTHYLSQAKVAFSIVSPSQSHGFTLAQGIISKNDRQAAQSLAMMGQTLDLPLHQPISHNMQRRKQLLMGIRALKKQKQALVNQLHAMNNQIVYAPEVELALEQTLQTVEEQLQTLEDELNDLTDEQHHKQFKLLTSVIGIGDKTAHLLLSATGGLHNFKHARQLSKFIGLVPFSHQSGSSVRYHGRITKRGNRDLRACLYMAARSAKRHNIACRNLYDRLRRAGKAHKKAMVAVMNKLIKQAFGVIRSDVSFDNLFFLQFEPK